MVKRDERDETDKKVKTGFAGEGYKSLIVWKNAAIIRKRIYEITKRFPI